MQAALYAYLLGIDDVIMVASFLDENDYEHPDRYEPTIFNTITREFKVSERYPNHGFNKMFKAAQEWWDRYVVTGISPDYDEKKDAEILAALRTNTLNPDTDIEAVIKEAEELKVKLDKAQADMAEDEKRLKTLTGIIKDHAVSQFRDGDKKVELAGGTYLWTISKSTSTTVDKDALKKDGLLDKYQKTSESYRITAKER